MKQFKSYSLNRPIHRQTHRHTDRWTDTQRNRQTHTHTHTTENITYPHTRVVTSPTAFNLLLLKTSFKANKVVCHERDVFSFVCKSRQPNLSKDCARIRLKDKFDWLVIDLRIWCLICSFPSRNQLIFVVFFACLKFIMTFTGFLLKYYFLQGTKHFHLFLSNY